MREETKAKLKEFLELEFCSVYCDTCSSCHLSDDDENCYCDDCHRKNMNWGISEDTVQRVISKIEEITEGK